jgi:hypothetical protein
MRSGLRPSRIAVTRARFVIVSVADIRYLLWDRIKS